MISGTSSLPMRQWGVVSETFRVEGVELLTLLVACGEVVRGLASHLPCLAVHLIVPFKILEAFDLSCCLFAQRIEIPIWAIGGLKWGTTRHGHRLVFEQRQTEIPINS